jgi:hypothetical protein
MMPILEFPPPSPTAALKTPLSPSRVSSNSNKSSNTSPPTIKSALKLPSSASRKPLDENNSVRFEGVTSPNAWPLASPETDLIVEPSSNGQQRGEMATGAGERNKEEEDVSMEMQSEEGEEFRALRGGGGGPLSASGSASTLGSGDRDLVPLHGQFPQICMEKLC